MFMFRYANVNYYVGGGLFLCLRLKLQSQMQEGGGNGGRM